MKMQQSHQSLASNEDLRKILWWEKALPGRIQKEKNRRFEERSRTQARWDGNTGGPRDRELRRRHELVPSAAVGSGDAAREHGVGGIGASISGVNHTTALESIEDSGEKVKVVGGREERR
nr:hypothetical protein Iba_chr03dCG5810 [Ipomoea batatas]GMC76419.1 hypothetical protein Iba_chr03eCG0990 [Ipomoea batatas]